MHLDHDHIGAHSHEEAHTHEHTHADGTTHTHEHAHPHDHTHDCGHGCESCNTPCEHTPMEELTALMKYMVGHNAAHAKELAELAKKLEEKLLPPDLNYEALDGIRLEARQKLQDIRPVSLGQAGRISGVSPADIAVLMIYLENN